MGARSEVIVSSDGRRTYHVNNLAQVDQALGEVRRLRAEQVGSGSFRMGLGFDADALLDRRLVLMDIEWRQRTGFGLGGRADA